MGRARPSTSTGDVDVLSLSVGYRVPAPVLELAVRAAGPRSPGTCASPSRSVAATGRATLRRRPGRRRAPRSCCRGDRDGLEDDRSVAVIVADHVYDEQLGVLGGALGDVGDGRDADFSRRVTLLPASSCKGLEFDAIVLVEPAEIVADDPQGSRMLYVAMTRCTQSAHGRPQRAAASRVPDRRCAGGRRRSGTVGGLRQPGATGGRGGPRRADSSSSSVGSAMTTGPCSSSWFAAPRRGERDRIVHGGWERRGESVERRSDSGTPGSPRTPGPDMALRPPHPRPAAAARLLQAQPLRIARAGQPHAAPAARGSGSRPAAPPAR